MKPLKVATSNSVTKTRSEPSVKPTGRLSMENDNAFPLTHVKDSTQDGGSSLSDQEDNLTPPTGLSRMPVGPGPLHLLARLVHFVGLMSHVTMVTVILA